MIMDNLSIITRHSRIFLERRLQKMELGYAEEVVIMYLVGRTNTNQDCIAKHFMLDKGTVTKTINKLEEKGFIARCENPENRREKLITLTDKGNSIIDNINQVITDWHKSIFDGISEEEIKQISNTIKIMSANAVKATLKK